MTQLRRTNHINAAIYAGVPSPSCCVGISVREQVLDCWEFCRREGWEIRYIFVDHYKGDRGGSKSSFQEMLERAKAEGCDVVVFRNFRKLRLPVARSSHVGPFVIVHNGESE